MEIAELLIEAVAIANNHRNRMPFPHSSGAPLFRGPDVTTFLHKYQSLAAFTATDDAESSAIAMLPYYCTKEIRETVMMMRGYKYQDWAALKNELLRTFRHADSRALIYTRQHPQDLCAKFSASHRSTELACFHNTEALKSFLRSYDHISRAVTERGMMCEYKRTEMFLCALPKRLWRKAVTKLSMHPFEPNTFDYGKLHSWVTAKITAAQALAMFEFLAPAAALPKTSTAPPAPTTSWLPCLRSFPQLPLNLKLSQLLRLRQLARII